MPGKPGEPQGPPHNPPRPPHDPPGPPHDPPGPPHGPPALSLRYHQHPAGKNLCLLGRSTDNWDPTCTLAWLLTVQLPRALAAARAKPGVDVADVEEHQAEPFEEYYASDAVVPAMILVQGGWALDRTITSGKLSVGLLPPPPGQARHFLRGVVLEVLTNNNVSLAKADAATRGLCGPDVLTCRWIRLKKPLPEFEPGKYFEQARALDPGANQNHPAPYRGGRLQLWGVVFDDEGQWRSGGGQDGWVFVGRHEIRQSAPPVVTPATRAAGPERYQQRRGRR